MRPDDILREREVKYRPQRVERGRCWRDRGGVKMPRLFFSWSTFGNALLLNIRLIMIAVVTHEMIALRWKFI